MQFGVLTLALLASPHVRATTISMTTCDPALVSYLHGFDPADPTPPDCLELEYDDTATWTETCWLDDVDLYVVLDASWPVLAMNGLIVESGGTPPLAMLPNPSVKDHKQRVPSKYPYCEEVEAPL